MSTIDSIEGIRWSVFVRNGFGLNLIISIKVITFFSRLAHGTHTLPSHLSVMRLRMSPQSKDEVNHGTNLRLLWLRYI